MVNSKFLINFFVEGACIFCKQWFRFLKKSSILCGMAGLLFASLSAIALEDTPLNFGYYGFSDYTLGSDNRSWQIEGRYRALGKANFKNKRYSPFYYSDASAAFYYFQFLNEENSLIYEVGYDLLGLNWKKNPLFREKYFHYFIGSLGYRSVAIEKWKWVINAGFSVDATHFDLSRSGVGHGMLWGQYQICPGYHFHLGIFGWYGVLNGRATPIFGFDCQFNDQWRLCAVYPGNFSLCYSFLPHCSLEAAYSFFGGPYYRYPRRAREGNIGSRSPIFTLFSNGAEVNVKFQFEPFFYALLGAGWNFGGWILIKNSYNHHGKYYHYQSAPYLQGKVQATF